jgi:hypothetical protein
MGRLIEIHEIDEFSEVKTIPGAAINDLILSSVSITFDRTLKTA